MHMFFAVVRKDGRRLEAAERQRIKEILRAEVMFPGLSRVVDVSPTPCSLLVGVSNEPTGGFWDTPKRQIFISGYCNDPRSVEPLPVGLDLGERISRMSGRFSILLVERAPGRFALATPPARVDSIFRAENDDFVYWGSQASVLSVLRDGSLRFAPERLMSLLDASFFGNDATPYEGVDALPSFTTVVVEGKRITQRTRGLWTLKDAAFERPPIRDSVLSRLRLAKEFPGLDARLHSLATDLSEAFAPLASQPKNQLALTGGMDSRLLLAAATAAGVKVQCFTERFGAANSADVWVAQRVASLAGVKHRIQERAHPSRGGQQEKQVDLLGVTKQTLSATDGMLGFRYPVTRIKPHSNVRNLSGQGGEILRGGYGEKEWRPASVALRKRWNHYPKLYRPELVRDYEEELQRRINGYPSGMSSGDVLDCLYVDLRCGRWAAGATSASTTRIRPLLDNAVVSDALSIPTRIKRLHLPHERLIALLMPKLRDLPLANKHWKSTGRLKRRLVARRWPQAFAERPRFTSPNDARMLNPEKEATIKRYVIEEDRLTLLKPLIRIDAVLNYVKKAPKNIQPYDRFLAGLYTVAVLLSEDWRSRS